MHTIKKLWVLILLVSLILYNQDANAQYYRTYNKFDITSGLTLTPKAGVNVFFGDLVDKSRESYSFGVTADREMTESLTARVSLMGGQMRGKQINPVFGSPYATFENSYVDFLIGATYKPLDHLWGYFKERTAEPYVLLQTGAIYYNSTEYFGAVASQVTPGAGNAGEEWRSASGFAPVISAGGGVDFWINTRLSLNFEFAGNLAFTDKLDAHDVWYESLPNGEVHTSDPYDFYYVVTAGVVFVIKDSKFKNFPKFNRRSYEKTRRLYKPSRKKVIKRRPSSHRR